MKIRVHCDCGKTLVAHDELAGTKTTCPACGAVLQLPRLDEVSEQPASFLVTDTGLDLTSAEAARILGHDQLATNGAAGNEEATCTPPSESTNVSPPAPVTAPLMSPPTASVTHRNDETNTATLKRLRSWGLTATEAQTVRAWGQRLCEWWCSTWSVLWLRLCECGHQVRVWGRSTWSVLWPRLCECGHQVRAWVRSAWSVLWPRLCEYGHQVRAWVRSTWSVLWPRLCECGHQVRAWRLSTWSVLWRWPFASVSDDELQAWHRSRRQPHTTGPRVSVSEGELLDIERMSDPFKQSQPEAPAILATASEIETPTLPTIITPQAEARPSSPPNRKQADVIVQRHARWAARRAAAEARNSKPADAIVQRHPLADARALVDIKSIPSPLKLSQPESQAILATASEIETPTLPTIITPQAEARPSDRAADNSTASLTSNEQERVTIRPVVPPSGCTTAEQHHLEQQLVTIRPAMPSQSSHTPFPAKESRTLGETSEPHRNLDDDLTLQRTFPSHPGRQ